MMPFLSSRKNAAGFQIWKKKQTKNVKTPRIRAYHARLEKFGILISDILDFEPLKI